MIKYESQAPINRKDKLSQICDIHVKMNMKCRDENIQLIE